MIDTIVLAAQVGCAAAGMVLLTRAARHAAPATLVARAETWFPVTIVLPLLAHTSRSAGACSPRRAR